MEAITVKQIVSKLPVRQILGPDSRVVRRIVNAQEVTFTSDNLLWVSDKNASLLVKINDGAVICSSRSDQNLFNSRCTYLMVENPRLYFLQVVREFFYDPPAPGISDRSTIDSSVRLGKGISIEPGVIIEKDCVIGDGASIGANTVIKNNTIIGNRVKIGSNNTIGGDGFGYEKDENGTYQAIIHIGNVVIEDDVEIGNNTAIDRAVLGSTILRKNCKIDNLVHIAHGVEIGENSLIIANAMIAGSVLIGKNAWVAPSSSVLNKLQIGDNSIIGMGAVVLKNVHANQTVVGNPAKELPPRNTP